MFAVLNTKDMKNKAIIKELTNLHAKIKLFEELENIKSNKLKYIVDGNAVLRTIELLKTTI